MTSDTGRPAIARYGVWVVGALCGIAWWAISLPLGAKAYGILGTHAWTGPLCGTCTGVVAAEISARFYRRSSLRSLLWYSPLSVYLAIAVYGALIFLVRTLFNDFDARQIPWAVGLQSILGMWWGITFLAPIAVAVQLLAYANHQLLRWAFGPGRAGSAAGTRTARTKALVDGL